MSGRILWRAALLQAASVAALSVALATALPHSFFDDWGWLVGPVAWLGCAALTTRVLRLPARAAMVGAVLAGLASAVFVVVGAHWVGVVVAVGGFAAWCARLGAGSGSGTVAWT